MSTAGEKRRPRTGFQGTKLISTSMVYAHPLQC
jgi:hypothetical protein